MPADPRPPAPRAPVIVGAAAASGRRADTGPGTGAVDLMVEALESAAAGPVGPLVRRADVVMVPRGTWLHADAGRLVAARAGMTGARTLSAEIGVLQTTLFSRAAAAVQEGRSDVVVVCGGEARWSHTRSGAGGTEPAADGPAADGPGGAAPGPDEVLAPDDRILAPAEVEAGLVNAPSHYALLENARRAGARLSLAEHQAQVAELWSGFSAVAAANPRAWFPEARSAADLLDGEGGNRMIAFPYRRWHVSQWNVDQAAAFVICASEVADRAGVPEDRRVHLHAVAESNHMVPVSQRRELDRSPGFALAGRAALEGAGIGAGDLAHIDLYSCFPFAVAVQARELGLGPGAQLTITGGMTFAGGPLNNYALQSGAAMYERLLAHPGEFGLLTAVSGMVTKQGVMVWSTAPARRCALADVTAAVAGLGAPVPVDRAGAGCGEVVTYTVMHGRGGPERGVVLTGGPDGRHLAVTTDPVVMEDMQTSEWLGRPVELDGAGGFRI